MKTLFPLFLMAFGSLSLTAAQAQNNNDLPAGFKEFKLTRTKNIFDPDRRPLFDPSTPQPPRTFNNTRRRENYILLTGTMVADGKKLAFFSGTRPEYSKVIGVDAKISDFTIKDVTASEVVYTRDGKTFKAQVGNKLDLTGSNAEKEEATVPGPDEVPAPADAAVADANTPADAAPGAPPAAGNNNPPSAAPANNSNAPNDVLRRMMERRAKETSSK